MKRFLCGAGTLAVMRIINDEAFSALVLAAAAAAAIVLFVMAVIRDREGRK